MPFLLAPTRVTASMVLAGFKTVSRQLDSWTLHAFNPDIRPR
jgi:hypothetical protein